MRSNSFTHPPGQQPNPWVLSAKVTILEAKEGQSLYMFEGVVLAGGGIFPAGDAHTQAAGTEQDTNMAYPSSGKASNNRKK